MLLRPALSLAIALAGALGCGPDPVLLSWDDVAPAEWTYLLVLRNGVLLESQGPLQALEDQPGVVRVLEQEAFEIFLVTIEPEALVEMVPAFDRTGALSFQVALSSCSPQTSGAGSTLLALSSATARARRFIEDGFREVDPESLSLSIVVPTDHEACFSRPAPRFEAFGAEARWLPPDAEETPGSPFGADRRRAFSWSHQLTNERVVAATESYVVVLDRGQRWQPDPARAWSAASWPKRDESASGWLIRAVVVDPERSSPEQVRLLLALNAGSTESAVSSSAVLELIWTPDGFQSPRLLRESRPFLEHLQLVPPDHVLATGRSGALLWGPREGPLQPAPWDGPPGADLWDAAPGPSDDQVVILGNNSALYFGRPDGSGGFRAETTTESRMGSKQLVMFEPTPGRRSYVVDSSSGELSVRRPETPLMTLELEPPAGLGRCVREDECGRRTLSEPGPPLGISPDQTLLVAAPSCGVILEVEPERGCVRRLPLGEGIETFARPDLEAHFTHAQDTVYFGAEDGLLLEARWGP